MNFEALKTKLYEFDALRDNDEIQEGRVDRIEPELADAWPVGIHPHLRIELLKTRQIPYRHQADAMTLALQGQDVVLESPTASGKTLAFTVPLLNALLCNPHAHALMVFQMNALSFDQAQKIRELAEPLGITVGEYHGGISDTRKRKIRDNPPRILLTNPEYMNNPFLGWRKQHWHGFLSNLCFIVLDEMHLYYGYFGSNMALLMRRFLLYLHKQGASPQIFLSTATCANPLAIAKDLTGRNSELVQARDAMRPQRNFLFVKPSIGDERYWKHFRQRIENATLSLLEQDIRALVFCPTIRFLSDAFKNCQQEMKKRNLDRSLLAEFHAKLLNDKKLATQENIRSGKHKVVLTTNALEVGLDIGGLDGIVLAGFPSNLMSAWQRIGRAGRDSNSDAFVLFYAMDDPFDNFFVSNINSFLEKPLDNIVVNSANEQLIERHIESLLDETDYSLQPEDEKILGHAFYHAALKELESLTERDRLRRQMRRNVSRNSPQWKLSKKGIRGDNSRNYSLVVDGETLWENIPDIWRFRHAYQDARITLSGKRYCVVETRTGRNENQILLEEEPENLRTEAVFRTYINPDDEPFNSCEYGNFRIFYGEVDITLKFDGYSLIDERSDIVIERGGEPDYHERDKLHAFWIEIGGDSRNKAGTNALLQILRVGAWPVVPADRFDTSTFARLDEDTVFIYENYSGGIGIAKGILDAWDTALKEGIKVARKQCCKMGCPECIKPAKSWDSGNTEIDKVAGIMLAEQMLTANRQDK